jgi:hypothetical protein
LVKSLLVLIFVEIMVVKIKQKHYWFMNSFYLFGNYYIAYQNSENKLA